MRVWRLPVWLAILVVGCWAVNCTLAADSRKLTFNRDIRPILSDKCFRCHGFDKNARQADLRLDVPEGAFADRDGVQPIVPGKPEESEVLRRVTADDPDERMPPPDAHQSLTAAEIDTIKRWIADGAEYQPHWAFIAPVEPEVPRVQGSGFRVQNPIDAFIARRLELEQLAMSPEADKAALLRRVTLDLTGLPPTLEELDAFLADNSPDAYEKVVDHLLASPRYGERMVLEWLDAARYADTNGFQGDQPRTMWPWRDWVVRAMNANMPFNQFTIEQIAGDLLPNATAEQILATGFNRNHQLNGEGGRIPEESRNDYVMDRVETVGTVWLGLTVGCCRCHSHKYDPLQQKEYYQVFAYFNNIDETGKVDYAGGAGNSYPMVRVVLPENEKRIAELRSQITAAEELVKSALPQIDAAQEKWERNPGQTPTEIIELLSLPAGDLDDAQRGQLRNFYRNNVSDKYRSLGAPLEAARKALADYEKSLPQSMVMQDLLKPRETFILDKGIYTKRGEKVDPGVFAALHPLPKNVPNNRLALAKWLVDPANPVTPRVVVNRYWQIFFGTGLVKTSDDFGVQGESPSHPELLDWLAVRFIKSGWDAKAMHRLIVTSATYRQSSRTTPELLERDPANRLLARGPRHRLLAYTIRDQALAVSGLLVEKLGGPPVKPYMAEGVWEDASIGMIKYQRDKGEGLYRRSLYTFWRRIAAPAMLFDISTRTVCMVRLPRTNTPLQALILMNDVQYVEAARNLAARVMKQAGSTPEERVSLAFRTCTSHFPSDAEKQVLVNTYQKMLAHYQANGDAADKLTTQGDSPRPSDVNVAELAAYTAVASLILNLDETITKE